MTFKVNNSQEIKIKNEKILIFKNFYKKPQKIIDHIKACKLNFHKENNSTFNKKLFLDKRHSGYVEDLNNVIEFFENLVNQKCYHKKENLLTNYQLWIDKKFNNYKDNYWWPHYDEGFTLLIYLNKNNEKNGLNIYDDTPYSKEQFKYHEHVKPWHEKSNFKLLKNIETPFNTAVFFNAKNLLHGCAINNNKNLKHFRLNQTIFFK